MSNVFSGKTLLEDMTCFCRNVMWPVAVTACQRGFYSWKGETTHPLNFSDFWFDTCASDNHFYFWNLQSTTPTLHSPKWIFQVTHMAFVRLHDLLGLLSLLALYSLSSFFPDLFSSRWYTTFCILFTVVAVAAGLWRIAAYVTSFLVLLGLVSLCHLVCILLGKDHRLDDCPVARLAKTAARSHWIGWRPGTAVSNKRVSSWNWWTCEVQRRCYDDILLLDDNYHGCL